MSDLLQPQEKDISEQLTLPLALSKQPKFEELPTAQLVMAEQPDLDELPTIPLTTAIGAKSKEPSVLPVVPRTKRPKRKRTRRSIIVWICIALVLLPLVISGLTLYLKYNAQYHRDLELAHGGVQHLQDAEQLLKKFAKGSFDVTAIGRVRQDFSTALSDFSQLNSDLKQLPGNAQSLPKYGSMLSSALRLVPLAIELCQAGIVGTDALSIVLPYLHDVLDTHGKGLAAQDLATLSQNIDKIQGILSTATTQINHLQPSDFQVDPRIGPAVATFRKSLPEIQMGLQTVRALLNLAPTLLGIGEPTSYLIEQLDSTELRPGGGFIGSYGIATLSSGHLASLKVTDTYLLDKPYEYAGNTIPFPKTINWFAPASSWSLRDSNLEPDFPTDARYAEQIYQTEGGTSSFQGVVAFTPWFIQDALKITGPIYVSEYNETVTSQNLVNVIHYHQLSEELAAGDNPSPDGHSSLRKRFTELLFEHFLARVRQQASTAMPQFVTLLLDALRTKDVQIYLNNDSAEALLQQYQLASTIQAPAGDSLFVVDANIISNKANYFMTYTQHDQITIDTAGNVIHNTTLTYNWPYSAASKQNNYGGITNRYDDYVRIYAPPNSILLSQAGWQPRGTSQAFNREVWAGFFTLQFGSSGTITLSWKVPGAVVHDAHGWHYHYLLQRPSGVTWDLGMKVVLPICAHITGYSGNLTLDKHLSLAQPLIMDSQLGIDYSCS
jgi:hypothetical protein